jgi:hypothetical protein
MTHPRANGAESKMKPEKLRDVAELVGIAAIVVSLIFVGLEVRQSAAATRGATQQALADSAREASAALAVDKETAVLTLRFFGANDWSDFSEDERFRVVLLFTSMLRVYENAHYQWSEGNLAPEVWAGWDASMRGLAPMPGVVKYWDERRDYFDESFRVYFEELMKHVADSPSLEAQ